MSLLDLPHQRCTKDKRPYRGCLLASKALSLIDLDLRKKLQWTTLADQRCRHFQQQWRETFTNPADLSSEGGTRMYMLRPAQKTAKAMAMKRPGTLKAALGPRYLSSNGVVAMEAKEPKLMHQ